MMADKLAGTLDGSPSQDAGLVIFICNAADVHAALTPAGKWQWQIGTKPYHGSLQKRAQAYNFQQYWKKRNMDSIYANAPSRWTRYYLPHFDVRPHTY